MQITQAKEQILEKLDLQELNAGGFYGEWTDTAERPVIESVSPINGEPLAQVAQGTPEDYERVLTHAEQAYRIWSAIPAPRRGEIVKAIGEKLLQHKEDLGLLISLEVGKTLSEGQGEVQEAIDIANFAAGLSRQLYGYTIASERPHHRMYEQWHPLGCVGVITAFNFPCAVWSWNAFIAAVVGDVVVWKPSSSATLIAIALTKIVNSVLARHDLPPVFFLISGSGRTIGERMATDRRLPVLSFTGSTPTGGKIADHVAHRFGKSILELGGNNAAIVTPKADMDVALKGVVFGALATTGQRCTSTRRAIVHEAIYDEFVGKMQSIYQNITVANPLEPSTLVGPLIHQNAVQAYQQAVETITAQGGKILCGGDVTTVQGCEGGYYVLPTLVEASPDMEIVKQETFAPILYVLKYATLEEALDLHNAVPQGLASAIFTTDLREAEYFLSHRGSDCGIANVNTS
ncbi:aldehyde dehydrogenase family protein, partial [candidate division KSB3 bacterium]|nr:aldehyde dehydrogenase family protein [candidate division KSB3 bacterium]MBD3324037.1 aldehyde dehydrogenase family protein [candidate division KSB3 bacterium]